MRTFYIYAGRGTMDPVAGIIITTKCGLWAWEYFREMLTELADMLSVRFSGCFFTREGICYIALTTDDSSADLLVSTFYSSLSFIFPDLEIHEMPDFIDEITPDMEVASTELRFKRNFIFPTTTGAELKVDSLAPLANAMVNFPPEDRVYRTNYYAPPKR
ncbi:MAG: hypothetical protein ACOX2O_02530 [Bdellovibrionota bacterium]